ncbi:hypothetical protein FGO68_gene11694 [Halteria grandinella]|uniref:Uncharacterized protein n=1 Tax=Halteria grandinella TaxID=5974 RepID=A0A8J8NMR8_HALGN|nr:hypothetical protein FGO68_gene11694 [Halteria grandinella]
MKQSEKYIDIIQILISIRTMNLKTQGCFTQQKTPKSSTLINPISLKAVYQSQIISTLPPIMAQSFQENAPAFNNTNLRESRAKFQIGIPYSFQGRQQNQREHILNQKQFAKQKPLASKHQNCDTFTTRLHALNQPMNPPHNSANPQISLQALLTISDQTSGQIFQQSFNSIQ